MAIPNVNVVSNLTPEPWLSEILGRASYRFSPSGPGGTFGHDLKGPAFVYAKANVEDTDLVGQLEALGFQVRDTNVTMELQNPRAFAPQTGFDLRLAEPGDEFAVTLLAATTFRYSRFHADPELRPFADKIKSEWARNYFSGKRGDLMVVAQTKEGVVGFMQCLFTNGKLIVDLYSVAEKTRRQGISQGMLSFAISQTNPNSVFLGTQITNMPSIRFCESLGFRFHSAAYVLHFHKGKK